MTAPAIGLSGALLGAAVVMLLASGVCFARGHVVAAIGCSLSACALASLVKWTMLL